jgi:hypothetical protein
VHPGCSPMRPSSSTSTRPPAARAGQREARPTSSRPRARTSTSACATPTWSARRFPQRIHVIDARDRVEGVRRPSPRIRESVPVKPFPWHRAALESLLAARERCRTRCSSTARRHRQGRIRARRSPRRCCARRRAPTGVRQLSVVPLVLAGQPSRLSRDPARGRGRGRRGRGARGEGARAEKAKSLVIKIDQVRAVGDFIALSTTVPATACWCSTRPRRCSRRAPMHC